MKTAFTSLSMRMTICVWDLQTVRSFKKIHVLIAIQERAFAKVH